MVPAALIESYLRTGVLTAHRTDTSEVIADFHTPDALVLTE